MAETKAADVAIASKVMELITKAAVSGPDRDEIRRIQEEKYRNEPHVYVLIPEEDAIGGKHSGVTLNLQHYGPGKHYLPETIAGELMDRLAIKQVADIRLMQPKADAKAIQMQARRGLANGGAGEVISA